MTTPSVLLTHIDVLRASLLAKSDEKTKAPLTLDEAKSFIARLNLLISEVLVAESKEQRAARLIAFDAKIDEDIRKNGLIKAVTPAILREHLRQRIDIFAKPIQYIRIQYGKYRIISHVDAVMAHDRYDVIDKFWNNDYLGDLIECNEGELHSMDELVEYLLGCSDDEFNNDYITTAPYNKY